MSNPNSNGIVATVAAAGAAGSILLLRLFYPSSPLVTHRKLITQKINQLSAKKAEDESMEYMSEIETESLDEIMKHPMDQSTPPTITVSPPTAASPTISSVSSFLTPPSLTTGITRKTEKKKKRVTINQSSRKTGPQYIYSDSDSDISYGDDAVTKSFRYTRRVSTEDVSCCNSSMIDSDCDATHHHSIDDGREFDGVMLVKGLDNFYQTRPPLVTSSCSTPSIDGLIKKSIRQKQYEQLLQTPNSSNSVNSSSESECIYLDYNGTTPIDPQVLNAMMPYLTKHFGNPSSTHAYGLLPRVAVSKARRAILSLLHPNRKRHHGRGKDSISASYGTLGSRLMSHKTNVDENSIIFTGCGTEADNLAISLALNSSGDVGQGKMINNKKHIITSNVEHPAINEYLKALEAKGECEVTYVPVNKEGVVSTQDIISAIRPSNQTVLVTLMLANNETGALQPVREVSTYCHLNGILFHTDAAQAVGKVSISLDDDDDDEDGIGSGVDMVTIVGHKIGAPKGIAALYVRPGCMEQSQHPQDRDPPSSSPPPSNSFSANAGVLLYGGGQENGMRAGTENVPYIVGLGYAASLLSSKTTTSTSSTSTTSSTASNSMTNSRLSNFRQWEKNAMQMEAMRNRLLGNLISGLGEDIVRTNGPRDAKGRLPNTLSVGLKGIDSAVLLEKIQMHVACSAGSACHASGCRTISPILNAMGVPEEYARGTIRLSVGPTTAAQNIDKAASIIVTEARRQLNH